mgnify:FL=1
MLDTTFPHDKPQQLYWNVDSALDGEAAVEISYFTSGLSWSSDYVVIADEAEEYARIESFIRVTNQSGEDYANASVRVVVGTINLVEKVENLARQMGRLAKDLERKERADLRLHAAKRSMAIQGFSGGRPMAEAVAPKAIVKEGLSE